MTTAAPLISFANELKSLIGVVEWMLGKAVTVTRRNQAGRAAASLDGLHFGPLGFRNALLNVASGSSTEADIAALEAFYQQTAPAVQDDIRSLRQYRDDVRKLCGAAAGAKLLELLDGPSGKFVIRHEIDELVQMARSGRCSAVDLQRQAAEILPMIEKFNADLVDLHDTVFPPAGAPRALL